MKKGYINLMTYPIRRSKWNPLRYILGVWTYTSSAWKYISQQDLDVKD